MAKDQDTPKPKAIPEDYILGGHESGAMGCTTSRTDNTDFDACSPYSVKLVSFTDDSSTFAALTARTDDTDDDGTPARSKVRRLRKCSTKDLVDKIDQRTQEVERLLEVGSALVIEKDAKDSDCSPCYSNRLYGANNCEWENLHDQANACLEDIHNRLVSMAVESASGDENTSVAAHEASGDGNLALEVQELRQMVTGLVMQLSKVKKGEAARREEICILKERLARVDRQAARACSDVEELRHEQWSGLQEMHTESPSLMHKAMLMHNAMTQQKPQECESVRKPHVPKLRFAAFGGDVTSHTGCSSVKGSSFSVSTKTKTSTNALRSKPNIPLLKLPGSNSKHPKQLADQQSRPFMGQNFFRK